MLTQEQHEAYLKHCDITHPCEKCLGLGKIYYSSTATWRGGLGGQSFTIDVCDACWGSGDTSWKGEDLRAMRVRINELEKESSARWLESQLGTNLKILKPALEFVINHIEALSRKRKIPDGLSPIAWNAIVEVFPRVLKDLIK